MLIYATSVCYQIGLQLVVIHCASRGAEYVVRGTISYADLKTLLGGMSSKVPSTTDLGVLPTTLRFDTPQIIQNYLELCQIPLYQQELHCSLHRLVGLRSLSLDYLLYS